MPNASFFFGCVAIATLAAWRYFEERLIGSRVRLEVDAHFALWIPDVERI